MLDQHRCKSRQNFGGAKEFCPNSPKLVRKKLTSKKKLFMSIRAPFFKSKHVGRHFCLYFQKVCEGSQRFFPDFKGFFPDSIGFFPNFHRIKTFGGAVAPPAPPPPTPVWTTTWKQSNCPLGNKLCRGEKRHVLLVRKKRVIVNIHGVGFAISNKLGEHISTLSVFQDES